MACVMRVKEEISEREKKAKVENGIVIERENNK